MKPTVAVSSLLILLLLTFLSFEASLPPDREDSDLPAERFSMDRALDHVREIAQSPHAVGFAAHSAVQRYLLAALREMGLEPELQSGYTAGDSGEFSRAENILARIPGSDQGQALLLLSHYDSHPHSALGASDAGSGVATILEGVRAFLASESPHKNDIIILFTDAEELGLNGADLFVNEHPWIREVGLVLNFEARGSGGPSNVLLETNRGNARLVEAFRKAAPEYPVANSLAYSIYKMLPNDTDLTVFREDADIEGINFAFIGDHFDYHTAMDTPDRLDRRTLAHQGSYLMPLLEYFSQADLGSLKSLNDEVYFSLPYFGLLAYSFDYIWHSWGLVALLLMLVLYRGLRLGSLSWGGIGTGFAPMFLSLGLGGLAGYLAWPVLKSVYPEYADMLHGFTYNGYLYIAAWAALSLGISFWAYSLFKKLGTADALVAPMLLWLGICGFLNDMLPGAAFFLVPGLTLLAMLWMSVEQEAPNPYILTLLATPVLWIFAPLVKAFPVGLGLKMMLAASLMTVFIFLLLLGLLHRYPAKRQLGLLGLLLFLVLVTGAHFQSDFTEDRPKPSSLLYLVNADAGTTHWATYERVPSDWTRAYLGQDPVPASDSGFRTLSSKYGTGFTYLATAPPKGIPAPEIRIERDTVLGDSRNLAIRIIPKRPVNRLEVFTSEVRLQTVSVNGVELSEYYLENRSGGRLITHYISRDEATLLEISLPSAEPLELTFYESSNDLLSNPHFSIPPRGSELIPMPFVLNDAVMVIKSIRFD